ncbi:hypothetical protein GCM10023178_52090 [Actinomadura luteofluorescens]
MVVARPDLGTLNHTALTLEAMAHRGVQLAGVVIGAWPDDPDLAMRSNIRDLETIAARPLSGALPAGAGALEAAVHGWDVAQATGAGQPIPPDLAADLLDVSRALAPPCGRLPLFGEPLDPGPHASPGDRLVAFLGRRPAG